MFPFDNFAMFYTKPNPLPPCTPHVQVSRIETMAFAAARAADYQVNIHAPELVSQVDLAECTVYANVFNGAERTRIEIQIGNRSDWVAMTHSKELDPYVKLLNEQKSKTKPLGWRKLISAKPSTHLWKVILPADLPKAMYLLKVRATNHRGDVVKGRSVIPVSD